MVNMNKYKDPCVYGLWEPDAGVFYVGRTSINAQNRMWEHIYRARSGHAAPVYVRMREVGIERVGFVILQRLAEGDNAKEIEAFWMEKMRMDGNDLRNDVGPRGEMSDRSKALIGQSHAGKPTWIKGKRGAEAGWTEERRRRQSERMRARTAGRIKSNQEQGD